MILFSLKGDCVMTVKYLKFHIRMKDIRISYFAGREEPISYVNNQNVDVM